MDSPINFPITCQECDGRHRYYAVWFTKDTYHISAIVVEHENALYIVKESVTRTQMRGPIEEKGCVWLRECAICHMHVEHGTLEHIDEIPASFIKGYWNPQTMLPAIN